MKNKTLLLLLGVLDTMHLWSLPQTRGKSGNGDWDNHYGMTSI